MEAEYFLALLEVQGKPKGIMLVREDMYSTVHTPSQFMVEEAMCPIFNTSASLQAISTFILIRINIK